MRATRREQLAYLAVRLDVGAAEPVNRLLRVADNEQLARNRSDRAPVALLRVVGREQQEDLRLQRIGILKFVDEDVAEPRLKRAPDACVAGEQIARAQQQVDEIERAGALLQSFVSRHNLAKLFAEERCEIGVGSGLERVEIRHQRFIGRPDLVAANRAAVRLLTAAARAANVLVLRQVDDLRLPAVRIRFAEARHGRDVVTQLANRCGVEEQRVPRRRRRAREPRDLVHASEDALQVGVPCERVAPPRACKIAPFGQLAARPANPFDRPVVVIAAVARPDAAPQRPPHAVRRMFQVVVQPGTKGLVEDALGARFGENLEQRIDASLHWPLAQEVGAEAMNRADVRFFQPLNGVRQSALLGGVSRALTQTLEVLPDAQLQLAGRFLGERYRDDLLDTRAAAREHVQDSRHQLRCLAGAGRRFDDHSLVECLANQLTIDGVGQDEGHGRCLNARRSASGSGAFRLSRRSALVPQTGRKSHQVHAFSDGAGARKPVSTARSMISSTSIPIRRACGVSAIGTSR